MKPEVKVFSRDQPCTKLDIHNCFITAEGYDVVQVDVAHSVIGVNVPRVMERSGYVEKRRDSGEDLYVLTDAGKAWLDKGIRNYLKNHPLKVRQCKYPPNSAVRAAVRTISRAPATRRIRRVRPA